MRNETPAGVTQLSLFPGDDPRRPYDPDDDGPGDAGLPDYDDDGAALPRDVCWEYQAGELPVRLSRSIRVF